MVGQNLLRIIPFCLVHGDIPWQVMSSFVRCPVPGSNEKMLQLRTPIYFQEKGQDGYGLWVWAPKLGKVAAVCHNKYNPKQAYVALVARFKVLYFWFLNHCQLDQCIEGAMLLRQVFGARAQNTYFGNVTAC